MVYSISDFKVHQYGIPLTKISNYLHCLCSKRKWNSTLSKIIKAKYLRAMWNPTRWISRFWNSSGDVWIFFAQFWLPDRWYCTLLVIQQSSGSTKWRKTFRHWILSIRKLIALYRYYRPSTRFFYWAWAETMPLLLHSESSSAPPTNEVKAGCFNHAHCTRAGVDPELAALKIFF